MKKISALLAAVIIAGTMAGCGSEKAPESTEAPAAAENTAESTSAAPEETAAETTEAAEPEDTRMDNYAEWAEKTILERMPGNMDAVIPYGDFAGYSYYSNTAERETPVNVLLPPDYSEDKEYPVLYILHGFYDDQNWMARSVVAIPQMLTELYEKGEAEEMIVVLPYIFTSKELPRCTGMDMENCLAYDNFVNDLITDLMPFIEENFSVKKGRDNTAITGFSMGGRESLFIASTHPELFGYAAACCPAPGLVEIPGSPMHPGQIDRSELKFTEPNVPRLLFITAGGNDGVVGSSPSDYHELLEENGNPNIFETLPGTNHDQSSVKPHLYKLFSVLFK